MSQNSNQITFPQKNCKNFLITCKPHNGGKPLCKLGYIRSKWDNNNLLNRSIEVQGQNAKEIYQKQAFRSSIYDKKYKLLVIAPGVEREEDYSDLPFRGEAYRKFIDLLVRSGIPLEQVYCTHAVKCKTPPKRKANAEELEACSIHLKTELALINPDCVVLLGNETLKLFKLDKQGGINNIHGKIFQKKFYNDDSEDAKEYNVVCTFSPGIFYYKESAKLEQRVIRDLQTAWHCKEEINQSPYICKYNVVTNLLEFDDMLENLQKSYCISFDTESTSLGFKRSPLLCLSFSTGEKNYVLPFRRNNSIHFKDYIYNNKKYENKIVKEWAFQEHWNKDEEKYIIQKLKEVFESTKIHKVAHNIKYDMGVIKYWLGIDIKGPIHDTMLLHYTLDEKKPHDLEHLADIELGTGNYSKPLQAFVGLGKNLLKSYDYIPDTELWPYAATDANLVFKLFGIYYRRLIKKENLVKVYSEILIPLVKTVFKAEWQGMLVDVDIVNKMIKDYETKQQTLLIQMRKETGNPEFNPLSTPQVRQAIIDAGFGTRIADSYTSSGYTTSKDILMEIQEEVSIAKKITEYRTNRKILSTYLRKALDEMDYDGRFRTSWNLHGTESGRSSCKFLHQIPRVDKKKIKAGLHNLRDILVAPIGKKLIYFDFSQIELRVLAIMANDQYMLDMFARGEDIHAKTASIMLNIPVEDVSDFNRQLGKTVNFGLSFGSEGYNVVKTCEWEDESGKRHSLTWEMFNTGMARFKSEFSALMTFVATIPEEVRVLNGVSVTPFGRERRFGNRLNSKEQFKLKAAEREAINTRIQSTAGDILHRTLITIDKYLEENKISQDDICLVNNVHDSATFEVTNGYVKSFCKILKIIVESPIPEVSNYKFPCKIGVGQSWTEAEINSK